MLQGLSAHPRGRCWGKCCGECCGERCERLAEDELADKAESSLMESLKDLERLIQTAPSREYSLAKTRLQEAIFWLEEGFFEDLSD